MNLTAKNRSVLFRRLGLSLGVFLALLAGLELALRLAGYRGAGADPYASFVAHSPLFVRDGTRWVTDPARTRFFHPQAFEAPKPAGRFRIFVFGGSVVYGYGLRNPVGEGFVERTRVRLAAERSAGSVEALNCGGICYASYRLVGLVRECLDHEPDAVVVMSGHNEFLEPRHYRELMGPRRPAVAALSRLRIAQWTDDLRERIRPFARRPAAGAATVLGREPVDERYIVRDDDERQHTLAHYERNLREMARMCRERKVPLLFCTLPSNLRDFPPFATPPTPRLPVALTSNHLARAVALMERGRHDQALVLARDVVALEPRAAVFHYIAGVCLDRLGNAPAAAVSYRLARDTDGFPHRAPTAFSAAVRQVATESGCRLFDAERLFEAHSHGGIPGNNLFLDQCHPNSEGHALLAEGMSEALRALWAPERRTRR